MGQPSEGRWWKKILLVGGGVLISVIFLSSIIPCLISMITDIVQNSSEKLSDEKIKIMMVRENNLEEKLEATREIYKKYQKLRKFYQTYKSPV